MQETLNKMLKELGELRGQVNEGFKGVHRRQDIANGRTAKIEEEVQDIQKRNAVVDSKEKDTSLEREVAPLIEGQRARLWFSKRLLYWSKIVGALTAIGIGVFDAWNLVLSFHG